MTHAEQTIRVVAACLAALASAGFVGGYDGIQYHNDVEHMKGDLPDATRWVHAAAPWMALVPFALFVLGMLWRDRPVRVTAVTSAAWLFSCAWPLGCIWAWEVPHILC